MRRLLYFSCIAVLVALAGCTQSAVEPISQQPIVDIDSYFWKIRQAPINFIDSVKTPDSVHEYQLVFSSDTNGSLDVGDDCPQKIEFILTPDSIYANGYSLSPDSLFDPDDGSRFIDNFVLLRNTLSTGDSSWTAGTLESKNHNSDLMIARLLSHFDTLQIATGDSITKYPDVLMIRYMYETSTPSLTDPIPYWIVYYAKNIGPVMFDKFSLAGIGTTQTSVLQRREIRP
jgi:hypothetical protein